MRYIKLSGVRGAGLRAMVDDEDYERLAQFTWFVSTSGHVHRNRLKGEVFSSVKVSIHREVLGLEGSTPYVDHKNRNPLDNRKSNLRIATMRENRFNAPKYQRRCSSRFKGVHWYPAQGRWRAQIQYKGKRTTLGYFASEIHAAMAYDIWANLLFGEFAVLNFEGAIVSKN